MIVRKIYYGGRKITHIYVNNRIVWRLKESALDYLYPVQTERDLYIPQILMATQTDTNLDFTKPVASE